MISKILGVVLKLIIFILVSGLESFEYYFFVEEIAPIREIP